MLIKPKDLVLPKAKSSLNNPSGYLPATGASACSRDSRPGEENALIVLHRTLEREEGLHHGSEPGEPHTPRQTLHCVRAVLKGREGQVSKSVPFRLRVLHHLALCSITGHWPEIQKKNGAPKALSPLLQSHWCCLQGSPSPWISVIRRIRYCFVRR